MLRSKFLVVTGLFSLIGFVMLIGCSQSKPDTAPSTPHGHEHAKAPASESPESNEGHVHEKGAHGGMIVSLGRDSYHVEAIVTSKGELHLYMLGNDETRVIEIPAQNLSGFVKLASGGESIPLEIIPKPQAGDKEGKASLFVAQLPESLVGKDITVTVPSITIEGERFRLGFTTESAQHDQHGEDKMPTKAVNEEEKALYLTPGGLYTKADIEANGNVTASQKFANFQAAHDLKPKVGDKICPVTLTKANPKCTWVVGGKTYEFCCPPCVDEFVTLAKTKPEEVKAPEDYVKLSAESNADKK